MTVLSALSPTSGLYQRLTLHCTPWKMEHRSARWTVFAEVCTVLSLRNHCQAYIKVTEHTTLYFSSYAVKLVFCISDHTDRSTSRCSGSCIQHSDRRAVFLSPLSLKAQHSIPEAAFLQRRSSDRRASVMDYKRGHKDTERRAQPFGDGRPDHSLW